MKKLTLFLIPLLVLLTACQKEGPIYYKASGEGYVYFKTTRTPIPLKDVFVSNYPASTGYGSQPDVEMYQTDENGFYRVRFMKRYNSVTAIYKQSTIHTSGPIPQSPPWDLNQDEISFDKDFLQKQKKTFKIDTLWLENY